MEQYHEQGAIEQNDVPEEEYQPVF
jgi:hypothetical protein